MTVRHFPVPVSQDNRHQLRLHVQDVQDTCAAGRTSRAARRHEKAGFATMRALVFPGQGSQAVGMGRSLAEASATARAVFEEVDDALDQHLSRLMFEGPEDALTLTENAQPALMAVSVAIVRILERDAGFVLADRIAYIAGHSLGEYSALCAAGALSLADTARLLRTRGLSMQAAVPVGEGAMAALLGADPETAVALAEAAAAGQVCTVANDNAPGQVVISGHAAAIDRAVALAKERGLKRSVRLQVSAPFHCPLMEPAAETMAEALGKVTLTAPAAPLIANVTAAPVSDPETIRTHLVQAVTGRVRWRESVLAMKDLGVTAVAEVGAGKVLASLIKRIDRELEARSVQGPDEIEQLLKDW